MRQLAWLPINLTLPIHESEIWDSLSFTRDCLKGSSKAKWTGVIRSSLNELSGSDGNFLEKAMLSQLRRKKEFAVEQDAYQKLLAE